jgi:serine/threonine-protein kinase
MGVVIAARHLQLDERVAIKLLRDDANVDTEHIERFVREAQAAVRLKSEHVARISDVGTLADGKPFMVMELLEGLDLGRILQDHGQLPRPHAVDLALQVCDALAEAHSLGIVHRDIKPTNLFVTTRRDGSPLMKVLDFGISKAQSTTQLSLTQTSSMLGTPAYMSPEQMRSARNADARSDIWSLGTVLYELVEGNPPFHAANFAELCVAVATEDPRPMIHAPELEPLLASCLAKSPVDRFPSIAEMALALEPLTSDPQRARRQVNRIFRLLGKTLPAGRESAPVLAAPDHLSSPAITSQHPFADDAVTVPSLSTMDEHPRRRVWLYALLVALLAAGAASAVILFTGESHDAPPPPTESSTIKMTATPPIVPAGSPTLELAGSGSATAGSASDAGSGLEATVHHATPPRVTHPPRPPHVSPHAGSAAPPPCDPFANPNGCGR